MRLMMKVTIPVEFGNKCILEGYLQQTVMKFVEKYHPESSYFLPDHGERCAMFFFDAKDASEIPSIAEPFFMNLHANVKITPVMNLEDMRMGVDKAVKNR